jgi:hypothetical protein
MLETLVLNTGQFARQYEQWHSIPAADRTWNNMETWAMEMYNLWLETSQPAANHGFGGNAEGAPENAAGAEAAYVDSLSAFSKVNVHNASTFQNLSAANNNLTNNIGAQLQAMQAQLQGLAMAVNSHPANPQQPPTPAYQPPAAPQYQAAYQQSYQPTNNYSGGRGNGGRGGGRGFYLGSGTMNQYFGRGCGGGGRYSGCGNQGARMGYQSSGQPTRYQQPAPGNQPMNPVKCNKNWNYCWTLS